MKMEVNSSFANSDFGSTQARSAFQWGGTIFALLIGGAAMFLAVANGNFEWIKVICLIQAQQPYVGRKTTDCTNPDTSDSVLGYTCNGLNRSCQGYLVFRSQPLFNTVTSISNLSSSDPSQIAEIYEVSETASFEINQLVIVLVNCSCSGDHYQANITYTIQSGDGYFSVANNTSQALSTCQAKQNQQRDIPSESLSIGFRITVPLRY
ncbi:hypothetical protein CRYUN_Cryun17cG0131100 [Craigia yunnanensis]